MAEFSKIVDEILRLLGETVEPVTPSEGESEGAAESSTTKDEGTPETRAAQATKLKRSYDNRWSKGPDGIRPAQHTRLEMPRSSFINSYTSRPSLSRLEDMKNSFESLLRVYNKIVEEISSAARMAVEIDEIETTPGATSEEQEEIESKRALAVRAVSKADSADALEAASKLIDGLSEANSTVSNRVEERRLEKLRIEAAVAEVTELPEPEFNTHVEEKQMEATVALEATPLTDEALLTAAKALEDLVVAKEAAELAVRPLRQMRAAFAKEAAALKVRIKGLEEALAKKDKKHAGSILKMIDDAEKVLLVTAREAETLTFPEKLAVTQFGIDGLLTRMLRVPRNDAGMASRSFLSDELDHLKQEIAQLPQLDAVAEEYAKTAGKQLIAARTLLGVGSGGKAVKAHAKAQELNATIADWRSHVGALGIALGQRKSVVKETISQEDPEGVVEAFGVALKQIRDDTDSALLEPLSEKSVAAAESFAAPFNALLKRAEDDTKAAKEVVAAKKTLNDGSELNNVITSARASAAIELTKARDAANSRAALTGTDRDMPKTAAMFKALVVRMQEVKAEPTFDAGAAELSKIVESVRELAFQLCGPTLLGTMSDTAKQKLSEELIKNGDEIRVFAEQALGGNPTVLKTVLADCGASGLAVLAHELAGESGVEARAALDGLIQNGGLGSNPTVLVNLIGNSPKTGDSPPVTSAKLEKQMENAPGIKSLLENFAGEEGQKAMAALLNDCGLATSPAALSSLLQEGGFDGDGEKVREFADAFTGTSSEDARNRAGFNRLIQTGGLGDHPVVLGPLAKMGGASGVKSIATEFATAPDLANLKGLMDNGGMSGDTGTPLKKHEHRDTLAKVFVNGLDKDGKKLKRFANAFNGPDGQGKAKEMLDAFNEFGDAHAADRCPGEGIKELLNSHHLNGNIGALATKFVPKMREINPGPQRQQAIRFAPFFGTATATEGWKPQSEQMATAGIKSVTASVLKRHKPQTFDRSKMTVGGRQSMFPPKADVGALIDEAMTKITTNRTHAQRPTVGDPPMPVEIGFLVLGPDNVKVNHFGPRSPNTPPPDPLAPPHPSETPTFSTAEINKIYSAIR